MSKKRGERYTVAVDFDGVLHRYDTPWINAATIPDPPVDGAIEWLSRVETIRDPLLPAGRNSLWYLLERVCARAEVVRLAPHQLRHGFATRLRRNGVPIDVIQRMLGHSRIDTTQRYLDEFEAEELADALGRIFGPTLEEATLQEPNQIHLTSGPPESAGSADPGDTP